ncbi:MAG: hypothetical protein WBE40_03720 [Thermoplasmata archaeon]
MRRFGHVGDVFPLPFVAAAILLVVLIVLTPVLTATGQPAAGSIFSQAELIVDALPGNNSTTFYVHGLGTTARYANISLGFASGFNWTGSFPAGPLNWTNWENGSNVLAVIAGSLRDPVAVNVTALYVANGASAEYVGIFAFHLGVPPGSSVDTLTIVSDTPGIGGSSASVSDLPIFIPLANVGSGGSP